MCRGPTQRGPGVRWPGWSATGGAPRLALAAPPLLRSGPVTTAERAAVAAALRLPTDELLDVQWIDNGPGWVGALLRRRRDGARACTRTGRRSAGSSSGSSGIHAGPGRGRRRSIEVRAFCPSLGVVEDPVTGSLNAGIAQWLVGNGTLPPSYVASQGTCVGRAGRVHVDAGRRHGLGRRRDTHDPRGRGLL